MRIGRPLAATFWRLWSMPSARHPGVYLAGKLADAREVVLVRVPAAKRHFHELDAGFDETAGHQAAAAERTCAVGSSGIGRLARKVECLRARVTHQGHRTLRGGAV